jgi:hypothetical protein
VDGAKLKIQTRIGFRTVVALADTSAPPPFRGIDPALATYADALSINQVFTTAQSDLILFPPADRVMLQQIQSDLAGVVLAGPESFGPTEIGIVLNAALQGINALTRLPCQKF